MADTTPDVTHSDELSVLVCYVDADTYTPTEWLVRIIETPDITAAGQAEGIVKCQTIEDTIVNCNSKLMIQLQACLESSVVVKKS